MANNGINAGAIIPDRLETMTPSAWAEARNLSVAINGRTIDSGPLCAMPGGANKSVAWLRADLARFGEALKPGDLVLAGTPLGLHPVQAGDHMAVSIDGKICVDCSCT